MVSEKQMKMMPATRPYVDRLVRIFRDHPCDDGSAIVLQDYALAALTAAEQAEPAPSTLIDTISDEVWNHDASKDNCMVIDKNGLTELAPAALEPAEPATDAEAFESCPDCAGSGYSNHPDSGQVCYRCDGQGSYAHPGVLRELITDLLSHLNPSDPETLPLIRRAMEALR